MMMKRAVLGGLLAALLLVGCMVAPGRRGVSVVVVPALPSVVVLEEEPYVQQGGYFYFYQNNNWSYAQSRNGPWVSLPRDRYPKEVKFKNKGSDNGKGEKRGHGKSGKD